MSNSTLDTFLDSIKQEVIKARSEKDWASIFSKLKGFTKVQPIAYSFTWHWVIALGAAAVSGWLFYFNQRPTDKELVITLSPLLIPAWVGFHIYNKTSKISDISNLIFHKDMLWDNELTELEVEPKFKHKELAKQFGDFNRGDEQRTIESWLEGNYKGSEHSFKFNLYHFRYIVVTYRTQTVGKTTTLKRVETPYHRYGMIVPFPFTEDFAISNDGFNRNFKHRWTTSSEAFNKKYNCHTNNEQALAKFLKPSTILALNDFNTFSDLNWELTNGKLCISFSEELFNLERKFGIEDPEAFEAEIKSKLHLKEINKLKEMVHTLITNSDNNFERRN